MSNPPPSPHQPSPHQTQPWIGGGSPQPRIRGVWSVLGIALAITLATLGLMVVASGVIVFISLNSWGNNK